MRALGEPKGPRAAGALWVYRGDGWNWQRGAPSAAKMLTLQQVA